MHQEVVRAISDFKVTESARGLGSLIMKLATTPEEQRRWMEQWRNAAVALEEVKRMELMELTEEEAWRRTEALLSLPKPWRRPDSECGLVEQQALFRRLIGQTGSRAHVGMLSKMQQQTTGNH